MGDDLRILAILTVRNGEDYVGRCLDHLLAQEVEVLMVDHSSTDGTRSVAEEYVGRGVVRVDDVPFEGHSALRERLNAVEDIIRTMSADWFIRHDVDEIMEAPLPFQTLREGIEAADRRGCNVVNFDEFVFLPTSKDEDHAGGDYVATMARYYFFEPAPQRLMRAFKQPIEGKLHIGSSGGHRVHVPDRRVYPESFVLRHYMALSYRQLLRKYLGRVYPLAMARAHGWNAERAATRPADIVLPDTRRLKVVNPGGEWDRSDPWRRHEFLGDRRRVELGARRINARAQKQPIDRPPMPIIVGVGRSGTTLLRLMLESHPVMAIPPETHFVPKLAGLEPADREGFIGTVTGAPSWQDFRLDPGALRNELEQIEPFGIGQGLRAFYRLYAAQHGKARWGDKTPIYSLSMEVIAALLPEAHFIHLIRDGRDVALSLRHLHFGPGERIEDQAADWIWRIREARQQAGTLPHYLEVRYEDLVRSPEPVLREVCGFLDLRFAPSMLFYHLDSAERIAELGDRASRDGLIKVSAEKRRAIHGLTTHPPDPGRVFRWKTEMAVDERREFEAIAADTLRDLGYEM